MDDIKKAVGRISGDTGEDGTAFLISQEYMLTSKHIFTSNEETRFKVCFPHNNSEKEYSIEKIFFEEDIDSTQPANDIAVIKLTNSISDIQPLEIALTELEIDAEWESYGFPGYKTYGERFKGTINDIMSPHYTEKFDINLNCIAPNIVDFRYELEGASGSPILHEGKVIAVFSNDGTGAIVGAASLNRSRNLLERYIPIPEYESKIQKAIKLAVIRTEGYISGFPDELQTYLFKELYEIRDFFLGNIDTIELFLSTSKYPLGDNKTLVEGIDSTLETILMIRSTYGNVHILLDDDFANLRVHAGSTLDMSYVYAQGRNQLMSEILLKMHNQMLTKSAAQIMIEFGKSIPPNPIIFANCSDSIKHNLCKKCGNHFNFEGILQNYIENEDDQLIKGIENNNFSLLNNVRVICAECVRRTRNQVDSIEELKELVGEIVHG